MSPLTRSWFAASFRFALVLLFTLTVLLGTSLLCAIVAAMIRDMAVLGQGNVSIGLCCSLIVWLFVAAFHLRKETLSLPAPEPKDLLHNAHIMLTEMGYDVASRDPHVLSTQPRFHSLLFGGGVQVAVRCGQAQLTGPKLCVELLRNRLRIQSHLGRLQQALREQHRHTEALIKRAELRCASTPRISTRCMPTSSMCCGSRPTWCATCTCSRRAKPAFPRACSTSRSLNGWRSRASTRRCTSISSSSTAR